MMKNEDIKKHFQDAKNVFVLENLQSRTFLFLLIFSVNIFGQVPINNFGHSEIIKTYPNYTKLTLIDFNNDGIEDIFLFGNNRKNFTTHLGIKDSTFQKAVKKFFLFPIDDFKFFAKSKTGENYYIFVSRNKRIVGLVSFTKNNTLQLLDKIKLDSYPTTIKIVNIDNDDEPEVLIYGNNFSGLTLVENKGFRLYISKIIKEKIFTEVLSNDSDEDDYNKMILVDMLNNSLNFYDGTIENGLQSIREIEFDEAITKVKKIDFNEDDFFDIAVATESGMQILLGDSVYSFKKIFKLNDYLIKDFDYCDLNCDKKNDLLFSSITDDKIIFDYNEDNLVLQVDGLADYQIYQSNNEKKLLVLSKKGRLNIFSSTNQWGKSFNYYVGGKPSIIKYSKKENSKESKFAIYDEENKSLNILHLDSVGNFNNIIKVTFTNTISDFVFSPKLNFIIGYSNKDRLLEKISLSSTGDEKIKYFVYAEHPITFAKVDSNLNIIGLELENKKLYIQEFQKNSNYIAEKPIFIDSSVVSATLNGEDNRLFYWKKVDSSFLLVYNFEQNRNSLTIIDSINIPPFFINDKNIADEELATYINDKNKEFLLFPLNSEEIEIDEKLANSISTSEDFFFLKGKIDKLFYNNKKGKQIIELQYNIKKNKFEQTKTIKTNGIRNFIVEELFGNTYLIYSNNNDRNISFKIISEKQKEL